MLNAPAEDGRPIPRWVVIGLALLGVAGVIGTALSPYLLVEHPLLLVALAPDGHHILLAAPQAGFWPMFVVGGVRRVIGMVFTFALLAHFGPSGMQWASGRWPRLAGVVRWFERLFARVGAPLLVVAPSYATVALAGASRMPWRRFLPAMVVGQLGFTAATLLFGTSIQAFIDPILAFLTRYMWESTAVVAIAVLSQRLYARLRRRSATPLPTPSQPTPVES